ncbi:MAG: LiaF-related protein [Bacteroidota bacterium]|nr:LiaF-related protein [Bacteroidota bacterium]
MRDLREFKERQKRRCEERYDRQRSKHGHIWTGIFILLIGIAALVRVAVPDLPPLLFSWQSFLIALGVFSGIKHGFKGGSWFLLILIGVGFLFRDVYPDLAIRRYIWPIVFIVIGMFIIFRPRRSNWSQSSWWDEKKTKASAQGAVILDEEESWSQDDYIDTTSIFGGAKKNILSKDFKGGDIVNIFGGTELNLTQADIKGTVIIEITTVFGGTKLIVPSNWEVKSEAVTIFGGLEDKRNMQTITDNPEKILVLKGTVIFGGIDIKSF